MSVSRFGLLLGAVILTLTLSGCGFKLRSAQPLPTGIEQIYLTGAIKYSPLSQAVEDYLDLYQIPRVEQIPKAEKNQTIAIYLFADSLDRRLLSLFATGQVAEYELVLTIRFQVVFPDQAPQEISFDITREYQDDPDAILAKSRELELVLNELRHQAADRIVRMLPSLDTRAN